MFDMSDDQLKKSIDPNKAEYSAVLFHPAMGRPTAQMHVIKAGENKCLCGKAKEDDFQQHFDMRFVTITCEKCAEKYNELTSPIE